MAKRFVPAHEADRRAIEFHYNLCEIEKMPLVQVFVADNRRSIAIGARDKFTSTFNYWSVDAIAAMNPKEAIARGGTYEALKQTRRDPRLRVPQAAVDEGVQSLLSG